MEAILKFDIKSVIKSDIKFDISTKLTTWIGHKNGRMLVILKVTYYLQSMDVKQSRVSAKLTYYHYYYSMRYATLRGATNCVCKHIFLIPTYQTKYV